MNIKLTEKLLKTILAEANLSDLNSTIEELCRKAEPKPSHETRMFNDALETAKSFGLKFQEHISYEEAQDYYLGHTYNYEMVLQFSEAPTAEQLEDIHASWSNENATYSDYCGHPYCRGNAYGSTDYPTRITFTISGGDGT